MSSRLHGSYRIVAPIFGLVAVASAAFGFFAFSSAAPARPVPVDGTVESATIQDAQSQYPGVDLRLAGDQTPYRLEVTEYQSVPDLSRARGQPITVWVDQGTTHVLAIRFAGDTFKGSWMDNPKAKLEGAYVAALALAIVALFFAWAVWWVIPHGQTAPNPGGAS